MLTASFFDLSKIDMGNLEQADRIIDEVRTSRKIETIFRSGNLGIFEPNETYFYDIILTVSRNNVLCA